MFGAIMLDNQEDNFSIFIASVPDREKCVCEIFFNRFQWAEISQEEEEIIIQFYSHPSQDYWEFSLDEALATLLKAKERFLSE
ncbi:hypothetical protein DB43_GZ00020 [Parachlamydia acanthamoebae]|nr:hypothetical protein DB43_GZ00020 [Parachlamydia acanthamoebae]